MIELATFSIVNNYFHNLLQWTFTAESEVPNGTMIDVYRSESSGISDSLQDYVCIASGQSADVDFQDSTITRINDRVWYYKLKIQSGALLTADPAYVKSAPSDYVIKEVLRRKTLALTRFTARPFVLLKKRTWGTHCTRCWDATLFRCTDPNCSVCYGTGWVDGYFTPIVFKGMVNASPKYNQILMFGEWKPSDSMLFTLNYPLLSPRDVVVDDEGKRWVVIQIRYLKKLGYIIEQQVQLAQVANEDKVYSIPIND